MTLHLLTGEYGPDTGGVGAYSSVLVEALKLRGTRVRVWDTRDPSLRQSLPAALEAEPGYVLLQYVPNALGARGANVGFCQWLLSLRRDGADVRVMFHEPYFYPSWSPTRNALAMVQRLMAAILLRASTRTYISTDRWRRYLEPYAPSGTSFTVLPIPTTLPEDPPADAVARWRARFASNGDLLAVHFGTYGEHVASELAPIVPPLLSGFADARLVFVGRGSDRFAESLGHEHPSLATRLHATGALDRSDAACTIAAADIALQPYPDGVTTRRTSVMAPLALGVATVTSRGFLTEKVWDEQRSVALADASDAAGHAAAAVSLLSDKDARAQLGRQGRRLYAERFSLEKTVDILLADGASGSR